MEKTNMLIGNNSNNKKNNFSKPLGNHFENNQFINKNQQFQKKIQSQNKNIFTQDIKTNKHVNPVNNHDMADKTLSLLHERLKQGMISLDEFNKKCEELGKKRQK